MAVRNYSKTLDLIVEDILKEQGKGGTFQNYWEISRDTIGKLPVRKFYVHTRQTNMAFYGRVTYLNVAILTDGLVIDIEGNITTNSLVSFSYPDASDGFTVTHLKSIGTVKFQNGPIKTLRETSNAQLVLSAQVIGEDGIGAYWIAITDNEYDYLVEFGKALIEAIQ